MLHKKKRKIILLDAHAIIHRAYHALPDFSSSKGEPTGALYGLSTMLIRIIADMQPDVMVACFDLPKPTYRHQAYEAYKAGRAKADDALVDQIKKAKEVFEAFSIPQLSAEGFEADDVLGTLVARYMADSSLEIVIASGDMDTLQLVSGTTVRVFTLKKGLSDTVLYDENKVVERFGFGPVLIPDYKGLAGDPSDNITGVPGVGDKTATALIQTFGPIEALYEALKKEGPSVVAKAKLKERIGALLIANEEEARFSKMLATIRRDVPITYELPTITYKDTVDFEKVNAMCTRFEFRTLPARLREALGGSIVHKELDTSVSVAPQDTMSAEELQKTALALWIVDSNYTNPSVEDMCAFARTEQVNDARPIIFKALQERNGESVYHDIELPLIPIIADMEKRGVLIDRSYLLQLGEEYRALIKKEEENIYAAAHTTFNISSPKQLGEVLYDTLQLGAGKRIKKTEGGARSTKESELLKLIDAHPIVPAILRYRELSKLVSTYIEPLPTLADDRGRLHAHFIQTGTTTGRMSSESPNMQNIPVNSDHGKRVRRAFVASPGALLLCVDYSQMELRIAAMMSRDEQLSSIFKEGRDVHAAVAARVFNKEESRVTKDERRAAKAINFGVLYGMGAQALRQSLSQGGNMVTLAEAEAYLTDYFNAFSQLAVFLDETKASAARLGYTTTMFGRRRYFDGLSSRIPYIRAAAERMALNAPIQGTGADIVKIAMKRADEALVKHGLHKDAGLIMQVHDELVYEVKEGALHTTSALLKKTLESIVPPEKQHGVTLAVGVSAGKNWEDVQPITVL